VPWGVKNKVGALLLGGKTRAELAASNESAADEQPGAPTPGHPASPSSPYVVEPAQGSGRPDEAPELAGTPG
jgi:hypothetical protein